MNINPDLLEKVQKENKEFCGLYQEHTSLKKKVEALNKTKIHFWNGKSQAILYYHLL